MSKITVTTIAGQTSGADANKVKIESGDELDVVNGDLTVDTNTLKVDSSNNRVGIGTASPLSDLHQDIGLTEREGHHLYYGTDAKAAFTVLPNTGEIRIGAATAGTSGNYNTEIMSRNGGNLVTSIKADAYGRVTEPLQPSFKAVGTNAGYITTTPVQFPNTSLGEGHNVGGHYNTSTHKFTAPVAGRYLFHLHMGIIRITSNGGNGYPYIRVNDVAISYSYVGVPTATVYGPAHITQILQLAANDYVNVTFTGTNAQYYGNYTELSFSGYLLG